MQSSHDKQPVFSETVKTFLANAIDLCFLAYREVSLQVVHDIGLSAFRKKEDPRVSESNITAYAKAGMAITKRLTPETMTSKEGFFEHRLFHHAITSIGELSKSEKLSESDRAVLDLAFAGLISTLAQDLVFPLLRKAEKRDLPLGTPEQRMTEELDYDLLVKYLGGDFEDRANNPDALTCQHISDYAYVLPEYHREAYDMIAKRFRNDVMPAPAVYMPYEVKIRREIALLQMGQSTQARFDDETGRHLYELMGAQRKMPEAKKA